MIEQRLDARRGVLRRSQNGANERPGLYPSIRRTPYSTMLSGMRESGLSAQTVLNEARKTSRPFPVGSPLMTLNRGWPAIAAGTFSM